MDVLKGWCLEQSVIIQLLYLVVDVVLEMRVCRS